MMARRVAAGGLLVSAFGLGLQAIGGATRYPIPPGILVLALATVVILKSQRASVAVVAAALAILLGGVRLSRFPDAFAGDQGSLADLGQWVMAVGLAATVGVGFLLAVQARRNARSRRRATGTTGERRGGGAGIQILVLLVLAPVAAEYIAAYDDSTGDPFALLAGLWIFIPLYGAPALLIRDLARRHGIGWPGIFLLAAAFGLWEAGVVDQSLFSEGYRGIEGWEESLQRSYIAPLGISLFNAVNFVGGHLAYSICAPIAVAESLRPRNADRAWVGWKGTGVLLLLWGAACWFVFTDHRTMEPDDLASITQIVTSLLVIAGLGFSAFRAGRTRNPPDPRPEPSSQRVFLTAAGLSGVASLVPDTLGGALISLACFGAGGVLLWRISEGPRWSIRYGILVAAAVLLTRCLVAFLYFPVVGDVAPIPKYGHNVAMLLLISGICYLGWRAVRRDGWAAVRVVD